MARSGLTHRDARRQRASSRDEWRRIHALYEATFDAKGNHAALTRAFFLALGETLGDAVQVALARDGDTIVAMALLIQSERAPCTAATGAPAWRCPACISSCATTAASNTRSRHGLRCFEPGAQGEHKLARGFLPVRTQSRHYLAHAGFRGAVRAALASEATGPRGRGPAIAQPMPGRTGRRAHSAVRRNRRRSDDSACTTDAMIRLADR